MATANNESGIEPAWLYNLAFKDASINSDKFWRARVDNKTVFVNFGRTGTKGTTTVKAFESTPAALTHMHAVAREKYDKGYKQAKQQVSPLGTLAWAQPMKYLAPPPPSGVFYPLQPPVRQSYEYRPTIPAPLPAYKATELDKMPDSFFVDLATRVKTEMERRSGPSLAALKAKKNEQITKFQNFLLGVAHAMACRAALRWSAGHPPYGKSPMGGEPWNAYDGVQLERMVKKELGQKYATLTVHSNPLTWTTTGDIRRWLSERGGRVLSSARLTRNGPETYYRGSEFIN